APAHPPCPRSTGPRPRSLRPALTPRGSDCVWSSYTSALRAVEKRRLPVFTLEPNHPLHSPKVPEIMISRCGTSIARRSSPLFSEPGAPTVVGLLRRRVIAMKRNALWLTRVLLVLFGILPSSSDVYALGITYYVAQSGGTTAGDCSQAT